MFELPAETVVASVNILVVTETKVHISKQFPTSQFVLSVFL